MDHGKIMIFDAFPLKDEMPDIPSDSLENPTLFSRLVVKNLKARSVDVEYPQEIMNLNSKETEAYRRDNFEEFVRSKTIDADVNSVTMKFSDGETDVNIPGSVRDCDVYVFAPYIPPLGEREKELYFFADACKQGGRASRVTMVMPYLFGQRGERQTRPRQPVPAQIIARNLKSNGTDQVITTCEHNEVLSTIYSAQYLGYEHLCYELLIANFIINDSNEKDISDVVIATPDLGAVKRAGLIQDTVHEFTDTRTRLVIANKDRFAKDRTRVVNIIGNISDESYLYISDDIGGTLGSMLNAVNAYKETGGAGCSIILGHPVLAKGYEKKLDALCDDSFVKDIIFADTIPLKGRALDDPKVRLISTTPFFAEAIYRLNRGKSISAIRNYNEILQRYSEAPYPKGPKYVEIR